jgi:succinate---hydroxymethylglutarate CoA-transferase
MSQPRLNIHIQCFLNRSFMRIRTSDYAHISCNFTGSLIMSLTRPLRLARSSIAARSPLIQIAPYQKRWLATPVGTADAATLPLAGIRVLDMTRVLAGVSQAMLLISIASQTNISTSPTVHKSSVISGMEDKPSMTMSREVWYWQTPPYSSFDRAEVIKIEHPTRGDDTRAWGPPYASYTEASGKQGPGESAYFLAVRDSIPLRLRHC